MFNKSIALSLVAAGLMIAPSAALAQQRQDNVQITEQNGSAVNGSVNTQNSDSINIQEQIQQRHGDSFGRRGRYGRYGGRYGVCRYPSSTNQSQGSTQVTTQNGAAVDGSVNEQNSTTTNIQTQATRVGRGC